MTMTSVGPHVCFSHGVHEEVLPEYDALELRDYDTDIQLKTLSRRLEVFNRKIIMRRDSMIF